MTPIEAVIHGDNGDLIKAVCSLYLQPGDKIADLTFGRGVFWNKVDEDIKSRVTGSDILTVPERPYDFRSTPYKRDSFDVAVLDPPYIHSPGAHVTDSRYQNAATTGGFLHKDIRRLYVEGMVECTRIAKRHVWVKTKDQVQSGVQRWAHCELLSEALAMGLIARDLFVLIPSSQTSRGRWKTQIHARKPHSFLWVFEKPKKEEVQQLKRERVFDALSPIVFGVEISRKSPQEPVIKDAAE
jgi:hypothetical protein